MGRRGRLAEGVYLGWSRRLQDLLLRDYLIAVELRVASCEARTGGIELLQREDEVTTTLRTARPCRLRSMTVLRTHCCDLRGPCFSLDTGCWCPVLVESFERVLEVQLLQMGLPFMSLPALAVSAAIVGDVLVGAQLVADRYHEARLLRAGGVIEASSRRFALSLIGRRGSSA